MARKTVQPTRKTALAGAAGAAKSSAKSPATRSRSGAAKSASKVAAKTGAKAAAKTVATKGASVETAAAGAGAPAGAVVPVLRRKELVARIVASSGMKPNAVKTALDAVLVEIGKAVAAGEALNIPPLGKLTVNRSKVVGDRQVMICKLRRKIDEKSAPAPLDNPAQ